MTELQTVKIDRDTRRSMRVRRSVKPELFRSFLTALILDNEAVIGRLEWKGRKARTCVFDLTNPLVVDDEFFKSGGSRLSTLELMVFYRDGSVLHASIVNNVFQILRLGKEGLARQRVLDGQTTISNGSHRTYWVSAAVAITLLVTAFSLIALGGVTSKTQIDPNTKEKIDAFTTAGAWCTGVGVALTFLTIFAYIAVIERLRALLPRRRPRWREAWGWFGFGKEDIRRIITGLMVIIITAIVTATITRR